MDNDSFELHGFEHHEHPIRVTLTNDITQQQLLDFPAFKTWQNTLKSSLASQYKDPEHTFKENPYTLRSVTVQSVDYFGDSKKAPPKVGFVKIHADIRNSNSYLPGIAFLRGGSVAMLMILRPSDSKTERVVVMTEQARIPAGSLRFLEIPAGMIDRGTFVGAAAKEIKEETGLEVKEEELIDLTQLALAEAGVSENLQQAM